MDLKNPQLIFRQNPAHEFLTSASTFSSLSHSTGLEQPTERSRSYSHPLKASENSSYLHSKKRLQSSPHYGFLPKWIDQSRTTCDVGPAEISPKAVLSNSCHFPNRACTGNQVTIFVLSSCVSFSDTWAPKTFCQKKLQLAWKTFASCFCWWGRLS